MTQGEMSINDILSGNILEFGFRDDYFFFFLHKPLGGSGRTMGVGPYFRIFVPLLNLLADLSPADPQSDEAKLFTFSGTRVGEMDINSGRMAVDDGEITRNVLELKLSLRRTEDGYSISMSGETGPVDPKSVFCAAPDNREPCSFDVSFLLKRTHLENMLADHPLQPQLLAGLI